jgi:NAD(P)H-dependent flavin oxidoreductase YrpB (nitropropane dioxygenase family)
MLTTRACALLGITHPVVLAGMGAGYTNPELVAAVSAAGGLGVLGGAWLDPAAITEQVAEIRQRTGRPFGLNLLPFVAAPAQIDAVLAARPAVFSAAWAAPEQDLRALFTRAHDAGSLVMYMVATVREARRAAEAGADLIVAQGTDGGGHVGLIGTLVIVPQVVRAVAPLPVLAAGGLADGAGLAAALMLGAEGVLLGTRFLATPEAPVSDDYKRALLESDGHDTLLSGIPDLIGGQIWPGAHARVIRNRLIETWTGREGDLRARRGQVREVSLRARQTGEADGQTLWAGQSAGLIDRIEPAGAVVERVVREAEAIMRARTAMFEGVS